MIKLSPSVLSANFAHLYDDCKQILDAGADMIHFDVMDGCFVDNISFGLPVLEGLHKALPDAYYDVHLMIAHPKQFAARFVKAGASCITFHVETEDDIQETIDTIRTAGAQVGMTLSPDTPVEQLLPWLPQLDLVLVMGVVPGKGGQSFIPTTLDKLSAIRKACDTLGVNPYISVDGGVKLEKTGPDCVAAGANTLVAGSAVFCANDVTAAVKAFKAL